MLHARIRSRTYIHTATCTCHAITAFCPLYVHYIDYLLQTTSSTKLLSGANHLPSTKLYTHILTAGSRVLALCQADNTQHGSWSHGHFCAHKNDNVCPSSLIANNTAWQDIAQQIDHTDIHKDNKAQQVDHTDIRIHMMVVPQALVRRRGWGLSEAWEKPLYFPSLPPCLGGSSHPISSLIFHILLHQTPTTTDTSWIDETKDKNTPWNPQRGQNNPVSYHSVLHVQS